MIWKTVPQQIAYEERQRDQIEWLKKSAADQRDVMSVRPKWKQRIMVAGKGCGKAKVVYKPYVQKPLCCE